MKKEIDILNDVAECIGGNTFQKYFGAPSSIQSARHGFNKYIAAKPDNIDDPEIWIMQNNKGSHGEQIIFYAFLRAIGHDQLAEDLCPTLSDDAEYVLNTTLRELFSILNHGL